MGVGVCVCLCACAKEMDTFICKQRCIRALFSVSDHEQATSSPRRAMRETENTILT